MIAFTDPMAGWPERRVSVCLEAYRPRGRGDRGGAALAFGVQRNTALVCTHRRSGRKRLTRSTREIIKSSYTRLARLLTGRLSPAAPPISWWPSTSLHAQDQRASVWREPVAQHGRARHESSIPATAAQASSPAEATIVKCLDRLHTIPDRWPFQVNCPCRLTRSRNAECAATTAAAKLSFAH